MNRSMKCDRIVKPLKKRGDKVVYWELIKKNYAIQLQYRLSHFFNNIGSLMFGFIYIAIWTGVLMGKQQVGLYQVKTMAYYMAFNQCLLWLTTFLSIASTIENSVRTGAISMEMARPTNYYLMSMSQEIGKVSYNFVFRSIPLGLVFAVITGFYLPHHWQSWLWAVISILLAMAIALNLNYLIGITACWTIEIRWAYILYMTLIFGLGGQMIPIHLLPGFLATLATYLPFASIIYTPAMIYLERSSAEPIWIQLVWCILLTAISMWMTSRARKKLEIQGG